MRNPHPKNRPLPLKSTGAAAFLLLVLLVMVFVSLPLRSSRAQESGIYTEARWLRKLQARQVSAASRIAAQSGITSSSVNLGPNVNVSNEPGPQSEVFVAIDTQHPRMLAAGSNEIFRNPLRTYFSTNGGANWSGADLPLIDEEGRAWSFASDPGVAVDTRGTIFFSQLLIGSLNNNLNGDAMIVNRTTDGGATFSPGTVLKKDLGGGPRSSFEDKPFIACDVNLGSPFRDNVYVAWDTVQARIGSKVNLARSTDHGVNFSVKRIDDKRSGRTEEIGADPAVGPNGEVYVAWLDITDTSLRLDRSFDGGETFGRDSTITPMIIPFDTGIPAIKIRRALVYPSIDVDRSHGPHRGRLYCAWTDQANQHQPFVDGAETDIYFSFSDDGGLHWSSPLRIADDVVGADQFYQWLSVDPTDGSVNISWYDTRNDAAKRKTDIYFSRSRNGGVSFSTNERVTTASTDESCPICEDCIAQFGFDACVQLCVDNCESEPLNQYGDYSGIASFDGVSHPIWTGRPTGERQNEEVFTARVKVKKD